MAPARSRWVGFLAAVGLLIATLVAACGSGCDTALTVSAGTAHRTGSTPIMADIQLDVSARLTSGGRGIGGVRIGFIGIVPGNAPVGAGGAVTNADGVAHYSGPADAGLARALTPVTTARTIRYEAQTMVLGSNPSSDVCNLLSTHSQPADLRYQP